MATASIAITWGNVTRLLAHLEAGVDPGTDGRYLRLAARLDRLECLVVLYHAGVGLELVEWIYSLGGVDTDTDNVSGLRYSLA